MKKKLLIISFSILISGLCASCATINKLFPKAKRPFQERSFDSKLWLEGDAQTRGEMVKDLQWKKSESQGYFLRSKAPSEILKILGEPDRKTRGRCCGAGGTKEGEVWLYEVEVKDYSSPEIKTEQFQIYFTDGGKVDETRIAEWDDKRPDYFPRVG